MPVTVEVRLYDRLFQVEDPSSEEGDFKDYINKDSLQVVKSAYAEPALKRQNLMSVTSLSVKAISVSIKTAPKMVLFSTGPLL